MIIDLGCTKKVKELQMKNIKKEQGGTKKFVASISESPDGPWEPILTAELTQPEREGCAPMQTFVLE